MRLCFGSILLGGEFGWIPMQGDFCPLRLERAFCFGGRGRRLGKAGALYHRGTKVAALRLHHRLLRRGGGPRGGGAAPLRPLVELYLPDDPGGHPCGGGAAPSHRRGGLGLLRRSQGWRGRPGRDGRCPGLCPRGTDGGGRRTHRRRRRGGPGDKAPGA